MFPKPEEAIAACLEPGDALLFDGAVFHGGGANVTKSERRKVSIHHSFTIHLPNLCQVHGVFMIRGNLRPEENTYLHLPVDVAKNYPTEILEAYGYKAGGSGLGWVDYKEPIVAVLGREVERPGLGFGEVGLVTV